MNHYRTRLVELGTWWRKHYWCDRKTDYRRCEQHKTV